MSEARIPVAGLGTTMMRWHVPGIIEMARTALRVGHERVVIDLSGVKVTTADFIYLLATNLAVEISRGEVVVEDIPDGYGDLLRKYVTKRLEELSAMYTAIGWRRYRKKPVVVHALRWFPGGPIVDCVFEEEFRSGDRVYPAYVETPEGRMGVLPGDYIVRGIKGEVYAVKPDVFAETYEMVDEAAPEWRLNYADVRARH